MSNGLKRKLVAEAYEEDEQYWLVLRPGWKLRDEDTHCIAEPTRSAAYAKLADVVPCQCTECRSARD